MGSSDPIATLRERLEARPEVVLAYLFGSRANGRPRPDSDWDVAVYLDDGLDARERFRLRCRLAAELEDLGTVDVVVLNDATALLGFQALSGRQLLCRDEVIRVRYTIHVLQRVEDERYWLDLHWRGIRKRAAEGKFGRT